MFRKMFADIFRPKMQVEPTESVESEIARHRESLDKKRADVIAKMGNKWILHPDHYVKKKVVVENSLGFKG